ncbi:hypothetical protein ZIOFF_036872 [Zingiber officinale]|uniref:Uncharacterized protein n=1 Tax=Zingiber officinale TaxID=94328 RepID=A0A8J5GNQ8_ZINOF|nr:hypothetical protein ZIOFF_036872 [Zingiber officinale]
MNYPPLSKSKDYDEALISTEEISSPAIGFICVKEATNKDINRQNNTIIDLLLRINFKLDQLLAKSVPTNTEQILSLTKQLEGLTLGKPRKKEPFYVYQDPLVIYKKEKEKLNGDSKYTRVNALVVLRDTRWRDDRSIIGTMEVDLSGGTQLVYIAPNMLLSIDDFFNHIELAIQTHGYEEWNTYGYSCSISNSKNYCRITRNEMDPTTTKFFTDPKSTRENLDIDYPISPNTVLPDEQQQVSWDDSDSEAENYWQNIVEQ